MKVALVLISVPRAFPLPVRFPGLVAAARFGATALQLFASAVVTPVERWPDDMDAPEGRRSSCRSLITACSRQGHPVTRPREIW